MIKVKYVIVGGGIAGCALACFMKKKGIEDFVLLERGSSIQQENEGFSLTLQGKTEDILEEFGLLEKALELGDSVESIIYYDKDKNILYNPYIDRFNHPVPRFELKKLFLENVDYEKIICNQEMSSFVEKENYVIVKAKSGEVYCCEKLFICSGIKFIEKEKRNDFKLLNIYGIVKLDDLPENTRNFFQNKTIQVFGDSNRFFSKPYDKNYQMFEFTSIKKHRIAIPEFASDIILELIESWNAKEVKQFIMCLETDKVIIHPLQDYLPKIQNYKHTFVLGDSAHPMSPYNGMGANEAIMDAYQVVQHFDIEKYYLEMVERTFKTVFLSRKTTIFMHTVDVTNKEELLKFKKEMKELKNE